jgi:hypothetical protein
MGTISRQKNCLILLPPAALPGARMTTFTNFIRRVLTKKKEKTEFADNLMQHCMQSCECNNAVNVRQLHGRQHAGTT